VKNFRATLFFRASTSCSKLLNIKGIFNAVKNFRANSVFRASEKLLKNSGVRRKSSWVGFIQWHRVVICIWCALFVTSQFDVIVLFPNQRFGEVFRHNMHIFLYIHSTYFMCHCTEYKPLALQVRLSEEKYTQRSTLRYSSS